MRAARILIAITAACAIAAGCTRWPAPVPRRTAYPRPAVLDTARRSLGPDTLAGIDLSVNRSATLSSAREGWLDIRYAQHGATVHLTLTRAGGEALRRARANRLQRLALNIGDNPGRRLEWISPHGFDILEVYAPESAFPYQFLATDGESCMLSGALRFDDPTASARPDSMAPLYDAISSDLHRSLVDLRLRP